ncbi:cellular communication network factor 1, like 1 [Pangasianodon hypophthalmus]|uniref:cellular communication network factor 1, like 1 n=1 Tax=Pangasianodon hypophthalmus TaxID=310915 RepID=UPI000EFF23ED|nr:cellular communication network factor 1, like 1 [Pangasianodon hypophthalmus]
MLSLRMILRRANLLTLVLMCWCAVKIQGECPRKCSCPSSPPSCLPGISSVLDSCGCCRVCARQFNQDCSTTEPCDHIKGLRCHLGAKGDPQRGLCRAEAQGRPCELDGRVYQHGEDFQPSCEHRCTCMDGVVGCMPLCPHHVTLPDWRCARPRLTTLPGRCCQEWVCDDDNHIAEDDTILDSTSHEHEKHNDLISNELLVMAPTPWDSSAGAPHNEWISSTQSQVPVPPTCFLQTTDWSPCSATCGMGVSSRVTNSNAECRLVKETRLCQIRECGSSLLASPLKKGKKCQRTIRPREPAPLTFAGCTTARRYRLRSCGSCVDGRCCEPTLTRTVRMRFHCPQGQEFSRNVMWIIQCSCTQSCSTRSSTQHPKYISLPNDIHTFKY